MSRVTKLLILAMTSMFGFALSAQPAAANTQVKSTNHVNFTYVESEICPFDLRVHLEGFYKSVDYHNNSGFLYKTINTVGGGGPFTVTYTAHGTTLTQQNEAFSEVITYNRDGSARTYTRRGQYARFTVPGGGIVLLDTGIAMWSEPVEDLLFAGGPHQAVNGDFEAFCAAFG
jgi:hypothetical protein